MRKRKESNIEQVNFEGNAAVSVRQDGALTAAQTIRVQALNAAVNISARVTNLNSDKDIINLARAFEDWISDGL